MKYICGVVGNLPDDHVDWVLQSEFFIRFLFFFSLLLSVYCYKKFVGITEEESQGGIIQVVLVNRRHRRDDLLRLVFANVGVEVVTALFDRVSSHQKQSNRRSQSQENVTKNQWELEVKTSKLCEARENANDQVAFVFSFEAYWLKGWRERYGPITEQREGKLKQPRFTFDIQYWKLEKYGIRGTWFSKRDAWFGIQDDRSSQNFSSKSSLLKTSLWRRGADQ